MILRIKNLDRAGLLIVIAVTIFFAYWSVIYGIREQRMIEQESESIYKGLNEVSLAEDNLRNLRIVLSKSKDDIAVWNEKIPDSAEMGTLIKQLGTMIKSRKIAMISIQPLPAVKENLYIKIPIHMIFSGSFMNIYQLLYDLEGMNRLLVIEKIAINKSEATQDLQVDLTALVFAIEKTAKEPGKPS